MQKSLGIAAILMSEGEITDQEWRKTENRRKTREILDFASWIYGVERE